MFASLVKQTWSKTEHLTRELAFTFSRNIVALSKYDSCHKQKLTHVQSFSICWKETKNEKTRQHAFWSIRLQSEAYGGERFLPGHTFLKLSLKFLSKSKREQLACLCYSESCMKTCSSMENTDPTSPYRISLIWNKSPGTGHNRPTSKRIQTSSTRAEKQETISVVDLF